MATEFEMFDQSAVKPETEEELQEFLQDENFTHFVSMAQRPGLAECLTLLEYRDYPPDTDRNELFNLRIYNWQDILWYVVSIPSSEYHLMEQAAKETQMKISRGHPVMLSGAGASEFPVHNDRVYTLINQSGHPVYINDPAVTAALREGEEESLERIRKTKF